MLSGCGGGGGGGYSSPTTYSIGGTVSGLASGESIVLQDNGGNSTTVNANGAFTFSNALAAGAGYSVTVSTQPTGQSCSVSNGSGAVGSANVTNVSVLCVGVTALAMIAGSSVGPGDTDGSAATARFDDPFGVAIDAAGNAYVVDDDNDTVRKITAAGLVSTFAGMPGQPGSTDGTGTAARFKAPRGIAVDSAGNVYVSDTGNDTIRMITPTGVVSTLAGTAGVAGNANGTGSAAQFSGPQGIGTDGTGNVYVADSYNNLIRKIAPGGVVTTLAGSGACGSVDGTGPAAQFCHPYGLTSDSVGMLYVADSANDTIRGVTPSGTVATYAGTPGVVGSADGTGAAASFNLPSGLVIDNGGGHLYVADTGNATVRVMTYGHVVATLAGTAGALGDADGTGSAATFRGGQGPAVDSQGNVYLADNNNLTIRKITPQGVVSTYAGVAPGVGTADGTGAAAQVWGPNGVATDSVGNVYFADTLNCEIRKMTPAGAVTTLAGSPGHCTLGEFGSADGTGSAAGFAWPYAVAVDSTGNVYVADTYNSTIRKITPSGTVSTFAGTAGMQGTADGTGSAARFSLPFGLATDSAGNVYVADTSYDTIRMITPAGVVTTLAGAPMQPGSADGLGSSARFFAPRAITVDSAGNIYVSDSGNNTIRKLDQAGVVTTLAGNPTIRGSADGTGSSARFNNPAGLTTDAAGNIYVADTGNYTIRKITPAGVVSTVVGVAGQTGFKPGALPGVLDARTAGVVISGSTLYISAYAGIAAITNLP